MIRKFGNSRLTPNISVEPIFRAYRKVGVGPAFSGYPQSRIFPYGAGTRVLINKPPPGGWSIFSRLFWSGFCQNWISMPGSSKFSQARDPVGSRLILEPAPVRSLAQPPIGGDIYPINSLLAFRPPLNSVYSGISRRMKVSTQLQ